MLKHTLAARLHLINRLLRLTRARMLHLILVNTNRETKPRALVEHMVPIVSIIGEVVTIIIALSSPRHTGTNQAIIGALMSNATLLEQKALSRFT